MKTISTSRKVLVALALVSGAPVSQSGAALIIDSGFDLFASTAFLDLDGAGPAPLQAYKGVPIGLFDFGLAGTHDVGAVDTIVERLADLNVPGPGGTIPIEIVGLQLVSTVPYDPDGLGPAPVDTYFATLQSNRSPMEGGPGTPSTGSLNIVETNPGIGGTFGSFFDVYFDLRIGALDGPIVGGGTKSFTSSGGTWEHTQVPGSILPSITGVDYLLNGVDTTADFWVTAPAIHDAGDGTTHTIDPIPEPGTALFAVACLGIAGLHRRRAGKRQVKREA